MSLSRRQRAVIAGMGACVLIAAAVCLFAPIRVGLLALLAVTGVSTLIVLMFLRRVLGAAYQIRDESRAAADAARNAQEAVARDQRVVVERLDRIEFHLPERLAARVAFELQYREASELRRDPDAAPDDDDDESRSPER